MEEVVKLVEDVRAGRISREEAEKGLVLAELCEFRALLAGKTLKDWDDWDCLDCDDEGFETCDIDCDVDCEVCIRYRLCKWLGVIA